MSGTSTAERQRITVQPFGVEIDDGNRNLWVCQLQETFRGRWEARNRPGREGVIVTDCPGVQLHVNPKTRQVSVIDPLNHDEKLREKLNGEFSRMSGGSKVNVHGIKDRTVTMDEDQIKTFVRDLVRLCVPVDGEPKAKLCKGVLPEMPEVEALPGRYLWDLGRDIVNRGAGVPRYEDEVATWFRGQNLVN